MRTLLSTLLLASLALGGCKKDYPQCSTYVDLATPSVGHDMCKSAGTRWIEGLIPSVTTNGLVPLHPNAAGLRNAVPTVLAAMAGSGGWKH